MSGNFAASGSNNNTVSSAADSNAAKLTTALNEFFATVGYSRFLLEFLRDNDKLFLGISELALHALAMALIGAVWLIADKRKRRA